LIVECEEMMTALLQYEAVPRPGTSVNCGLVGVSDASLTFLGCSGTGLFGGLRRSTMSAVTGSRWRIQLELSAHGTTVAALRENPRCLGKRERKHCGSCECYCKYSHEFLRTC
jgi:hypothetical protein